LHSRQCDNGEKCEVWPVDFISIGSHWRLSGLGTPLESMIPKRRESGNERGYRSMPVEFVGALAGHNQFRGPPGGGPFGLEYDFLRDLAIAHEHAGFDRVLMLGGGDPIVATQFAASHTSRLGFMIPYRPGLSTPQHGAKQLAVLDHVSGGRIRDQAISLITAEPGHGDLLSDMDER
jgi:hypothetical protein